MNPSTFEPTEDYRAAVKEAVLREETFLRLTLSGQVHGKKVPWVKVVVRPVLIKGRRHMQFSYFDGKKDTTRNFAAPEFLERLDEVLATPFSRFHVQSTTGDLHVRITKKGKPLIQRAKPSSREQQPTLAHDHVKRHPLPAGMPDDLLQMLGIMNQTGRVRPAMQGKFRQINEFLRLMQPMVAGEADRRQSCDAGIEIVDCGCGSAYLTLAAYHYLNHIQGRPAHVVGIDSNEEIIEKCGRLRDSLGWDGADGVHPLEFYVSRIADFSPARPPDIVLSLHACDTATDEAIALGILWGSRVIMAAPCCQHELHSQLQAPLFQPVLRHGILRQRTADILTDAFRALVLQIMGYRTDVVEFVSPEHTSRNLMIQAKNVRKPGDKALLQEYHDLKDFWKVEPCIERLVGEEMRKHLDRD